MGIVQGDVGFLCLLPIPDRGRPSIPGKTLLAGCADLEGKLNRRRFPQSRIHAEIILFLSMASVFSGFFSFLGLIFACVSFIQLTCVFNKAEFIC